MSTFLYYNPQTNKIEQKQPIPSIKPTSGPYLMNILPEGMNIALKNTQNLHGPNSKFTRPSFLDNPQVLPNKENQFRYANSQEMKKDEDLRQGNNNSMVGDKVKNPIYTQLLDIGEGEMKPVFMRFVGDEGKDHQPRNQTQGNDQQPRNQTWGNNSQPKNQGLAFEPPRNQGLIFERPKNFEFLRVDSISEKDMKVVPKAFRAEEASNDDSKEEEEEENRRKLKILKEMKKEDEPSLTEKLLNAKGIAKHREETLKVQMKLLDFQLENMDKHLMRLENEHDEQSKTSEVVQERMQGILKELERMALERKADAIMKDIDKALDTDNPSEGELNDEQRTNRLMDFFNENARLYEEINKVMKGDIISNTRDEEEEEEEEEQGEREEGLLKSENSYSYSLKSGNKGKMIKIKQDSGKGRSNSNSYYGGSGYENKPRKNITSTVNSKLNNWTKIEMRKSSGGRQDQTANLKIKNPKKVEALLQNAKRIAQGV